MRAWSVVLSARYEIRDAGLKEQPTGGKAIEAFFISYGYRH